MHPAPNDPLIRMISGTAKVRRVPESLASVTKDRKSHVSSASLGVRTSHSQPRTRKWTRLREYVFVCMHDSLLFQDERMHVSLFRSLSLSPPFQPLNRREQATCSCCCLNFRVQMHLLFRVVAALAIETVSLASDGREGGNCVLFAS